MELTIPDLGLELSEALEAAASSKGAAAPDLARDLIAFGLKAGLHAAPLADFPLSADEARRRDEVVAELRSIRAMTLKPMQFDSTLIIREMRDTR